MSPSKKLQSSWLKLMNGTIQIARQSEKFQLVHAKNNTIFIDVDWTIQCFFINNKYLEIQVAYKNEVYLTARHLNSFSATTTTALEYIINNR